MRSRNARRFRPRHAAIGALALGTTLSVTTLAPALAAPASESSAARPVPVLRDPTLRLGQRADLRGRFPASDAGRAVALQYAPRGGAWRTLATAAVGADGRYRFDARLERSGALRTALLPEGGAAAATLAAPAAGPVSRALRVAVAGRLVVRRGAIELRAGAAGRLSGTLLPRTRGRLVLVEASDGGRWHVVARARTRANGHFTARLATHGAGAQRLRVRFAGDVRNAGTRSAAGTLRAFRPALASWYDLYGGALACGGTLGYGTLGVANKTLPCGTLVTLRYGRREITVPVIDRGPYVGGREWDLTGATARALGFGGVGVVWSTR
ncbi:MAG TPA: septal ring lytic transglycosylase RlpA family protein [Conexibacter sp.]|nr:septal ring lytic transglycosylase RlpA family protein [Conexibacter sp.]